MKRLVTAGALALCSGPIWAEGWTVSDLGLTPGLEQCMENAARVFAKFKLFNTFEVGPRKADEWIVYQYDLNEAGDDGLIACLDGGSGTHAVMTIFTNSDTPPDGIRDRLVEDFKSYSY